jgi:hypothetical protein
MCLASRFRMCDRTESSRKSRWNLTPHYNNRNRSRVAMRSLELILRDIAASRSRKVVSTFSESFIPSAGVPPMKDRLITIVLSVSAKMGLIGQRTVASPVTRADGLSTLRWDNSRRADAYLILRDGEEHAGRIRFQTFRPGQQDHPLKTISPSGPFDRRSSFAKTSTATAATKEPTSKQF